MKTIEQRLADAIEELESLLSEGEAPEDAVSLAAASEHLKPEVLQQRAEKALGDLRAVKAKNDARADRIAQEHKAKRAIYEFAEMDKVYADFPRWFSERIGRLPDESEVEEMKHLSMEAILRKVFGDL